MTMLGAAQVLVELHFIANADLYALQNQQKALDVLKLWPPSLTLILIVMLSSQLKWLLSCA